MPAQRACAAPLPVCAAFVLTAANHPDVGIEPVPPGDAFWLLEAYTHRKRAMDAMGQRPAHFRTVIALARRVPVARVTRPRHPFLLDALADRVAAHLHDAGSAVPASSAGKKARPGRRHARAAPSRRPGMRRTAEGRCATESAGG